MRREVVAHARRGYSVTPRRLVRPVIEGLEAGDVLRRVGVDEFGDVPDVVLALAGVFDGGQLVEEFNEGQRRRLGVEGAAAGHDGD